MANQPYETSAMYQLKVGRTHPDPEVVAEAVERRAAAKRPIVLGGREPKKTHLALLPQPLKRRHHIVEHLSDAERFPAARLGERWRPARGHSRTRLPSSDFATASAMPPKSRLGSRTLVPTATLAGLSLCRTRPRFFSDSPLPYCTAVSK